MLRSMYSGISGLKNSQTKLDVIGNNIANVNTYGFKKSRVTFKDLMSQTTAGASAATETRGGTNPKQIGLGSTLATIDVIHEGSSTQMTNRSLDAAINGDGYFVVRQGDALFYTRAGNFYLDGENGTINTGDGLLLQAYQYDALGNLTNEIGDVAVNMNAVMPSAATKSIGFSGNLPANANVGFVYSQQIKVIDGNGNDHAINVDFKKTAAGWDLYINQDLSVTTPAPTITQSLTFNGTTGAVSPTTGTTNITIPSTPTNITINGIALNFANLTQKNGEATALVDPDGNTAGKLESFNIGASGDISGVYSNGEIVKLGRIALAKFNNPSGLTKAGNNLYQESINSGPRNIGPAGEGRGTLASGALEMSNVDLSEEFTEMIVAQRSFQANTRIITTSDEILQELVNLKR